MEPVVEELVEGTELVERAAAVDVAKASGMVCVRLPHRSGDGRRSQRVWSVSATTPAILELGAGLVRDGVTRVVMEATGVYWKPWFFLLESVGLQCWLVNARDVKNVPGRPKTDKLDAVWLCKLNERGMLRPSFVPPKPVRQLRDFTRTRTVFVQERTRTKQRAEKLLEDAQLKLSSVATDAFGTSGRAMMDALVAGERNPHRLADLAQGKLKAKHEALVQAMTGQFEDHHAELLGLLLDTLDHLDRQIDRLTTRIEQLLTPDPDGGGPGQASPPADLVERLDQIPGIGPRAAQIILAEVGWDMSVFPTAAHLVSWAKLCPRTIQSGGRNTSGPNHGGDPWLRGTLGESAMAAARTDTFLGARYRRLVKRTGHTKALVAVARSILVIVWHLINDPDAVYQDLGPQWHGDIKTPPARRATSSATSNDSATRSPSPQPPTPPPEHPPQTRPDGSAARTHQPAQPTSHFPISPASLAGCK